MKANNLFTAVSARQDECKNPEMEGTKEGGSKTQT